MKELLVPKKGSKVYSEIIRLHGGDILVSENFEKTKGHIQHGSMNVYNHCINVARISIYFSLVFGIKCDMRALVRGALLHDYFLYDWHTKDDTKPLRLHGFFHPGIALANALQEYELTEVEKDIIKKHMWPLTVVPPLFKETWIVVAADKYCSIVETLHIKRGFMRKAGMRS